MKCKKCENNVTITVNGIFNATIMPYVVSEDTLGISRIWLHVANREIKLKDVEIFCHNCNKSLTVNDIVVYCYVCGAPIPIKDINILYSDFLCDKCVERNNIEDAKKINLNEISIRIQEEE